ncbi:hypothetical protein N7505_002285 [Penicillium chrysogenum]|uniref:Uncharacterized protein n=1 Tax=Penicillium chrysogenum TaxID=5076 RepID=A0ABQ8WZ92_PENCH|nr:hypothetical protein N7505_002285 [Penicillium chrysogenum]
MGLEATNETTKASVTQSPAEQQMNPFLAERESLAPSNIETLCIEAIKNGYDSCIWESNGLEIHTLRNQCGWWKRISLRSPVKIQEVKMHAITVHRNKEVEVMVLPVDHSMEMENMQRILEDWSSNSEECNAGYNEDGTFRACRLGDSCPNTLMDDLDDFFCSQERHHQLRARLRNLQHRQPMLDFYWNSKGKSDCQNFLEKSNLVTRYANLKTCHYIDAALRYGDISIGESIPALLLIDGWDVSRLLILIGFAIFIAIIATAIGTAAGHDIDTGLTAGSYAFGAIAVVLATLTFFSAIL